MSTKSFNVETIRRDFPILAQTIHNKNLVYLDNAATSQKPQCVIDAISQYYETTNANVHRGVYYLSECATARYENTREQLRQFVHAPSIQEIVFTRGTTEAINLVAQSYGRTFLQADDEILISQLEHHSNIVPWQLLCEQTGLQLKVAPVNDEGELIIDAFANLLSSKTRLVALTHISNAIGTINPVKQLTEMAHAVGAKVLIDGAQAAPHLVIDVQDLDCDFYTISGHKMFGPTGIGALYAKAELLDAMPPYQGGGEMIQQVSFKHTSYAPIPYKFEAGTQHIAGVIGLGAAIEYMNQLDRNAVSQYEQDLLNYAQQRTQAESDICIVGSAQHKSSILSFVMDDIHPHDISTILDQHGIAIRAGHHCAMPLMERLQVVATSRVSIALYNTRDDIDKLFDALASIRTLFHG